MPRAFVLARVRKRFTPDNDEPLTNDWWALHSEDDANARDARKPKDVDMRKGVELRTCYITMRDGVKVSAHFAFLFIFFRLCGLNYGRAVAF